MHSPFRQGLTVYPDSSELAIGAARFFIDSFEKAVSEKGFFSAVLSGGATPLKLYRQLCSNEYAAVRWEKAHFFWGDERCVPPESAESNFNAASQGLLSNINIPPENLHRIKGELAPMDAATAYEKELVSFFGLADGAPPPFDLVLLGLGKDGHTLSLFPGTKALEETGRCVAANHVPALNSWRVTLTLKAVQGARRAVFLVSGKEKAAVLKEVFDGKDLPAGRVRAKEVFWLADNEAAIFLKE
jgi:6-phosphogluconolactonase